MCLVGQRPFARPRCGLDPLTQHMDEHKHVWICMDNKMWMDTKNMHGHNIDGHKNVHGHAWTQNMHRHVWRQYKHGQKIDDPLTQYMHGYVWTQNI